MGAVCCGESISLRRCVAEFQHFDAIVAGGVPRDTLCATAMGFGCHAAAFRIGRGWLFERVRWFEYAR